MRRAVVLVALVAILAVVNWQIAAKEQLLREGAVLLIELAPVDPRSLMQGDYMALDYAMARQAAGHVDWPRDGHLVVAKDERGVAQFVRLHQSGAPLAAGEQLLRYRRRDWRVRIGTDAFYFQEGHAGFYTGARFGELRVSPDGDTLLVGLRDKDGRPLGPEHEPAPETAR